MDRNSGTDSQRERSPSMETTNTRPNTAEHTRAVSQPQPQTTSHPTNSTSTTTPVQSAARDEAIRNFFRGNGPRDPPRPLVQMNDLTVANRDLTLLFGAAPLPPTDYPDTFANVHAARLSPAARDRMKRLCQSDRMQAVPPLPEERQTVRSASAPDLAPPAAGGQRARQALQPPAAQANTPIARAVARVMGPPAPAPATPAPAPTAPVPAAAAPAPTNTTTAAPAGTTNPQLGTAALPGESEHDKIVRYHNIDIDSGAVYQDRTAAIPQNVQALANQINATKKNGQGFPVRVDLKKLGEFTSAKGTLRYNSALWAWYGDTRLFDRRMWYYLVTEGRGTQVP